MHSDDSLLDSCTKFELYVDKAIELGQPAIAFSEHGKPLQWVKKKMYCDKQGIKYIHAVEIYLTESLEEKIRDNYHTVLIAKNLQGVKELNLAVSKSCDKEHFYYVNRLSFEEFLKLSSNIIATSACLGSPLNKLPITHPMYEKLVKRYDYLEVQPHDCQEQRDFNVHLAELAQKYKKPLIAGTDTHSLDSYKAECRRILLKYKNKSYGDEDTYDLTFKSREELEAAFAQQGVLTPEIYREAMDNTVAMAEQVEEFELDTSIKYPILYGSQEEDDRVFAERIKRMLQEKLDKGTIPIEQKEGFIAALEEEQRVFKKIGMSGFMLCMSELICWCKENNIPIGPARGSVGGSRVAYVTDIIDLNPEQWHTVFSRFANSSRVEIGDIDVDLIETDRPKIFNYIIGRFGERKTARVPSFGTIVEKGTIKAIGNALAKYWEEEKTGVPFKPSDKFSDDNPYLIKHIEVVVKEFTANEDSARKAHPEIFYYYDGLLNTKISQSVHPAGMVISPITLDDTYGVFDKDGCSCLMIDMNELHEVGAAKFDFLVLNNIKIISDACRMANIPYPRTDEIDFDDQAVWKDMLRSPIGIFQMEKPHTHSMLKQFNPKSIFDMSLVNAALRPSGASYRDRLFDRQINKNPSPEIDELLKDNYGFLVYQEDILNFLQKICGLSGGEADNVRRAVARKDEERLNTTLPQILNGYCEKSNKPREVAEQEVQAFLQVIKDSYSFNYNHSIAYCLIGYICAYLRYYYPYEFITSYLNNAASEEDVVNGTVLADEYGIQITAPKFGASKGEFYFNKETKTIAKGISSVKFLSNQIANELFELSRDLHTDKFMEVLMGISNQTSMDSRQLEILIKIDFFSQYGNTAELLKMKNIYSFFNDGQAKTIKKDKVSGALADILPKFATDVGTKGNKLKSYTITDMVGLLYACEDYVRSLNVLELDMRVRIQNSLDYLGYVGIQTNRPEDRRKLLVLDIIPLKGNNGAIWAYKLTTQSLGTSKQSSLTLRSQLYNIQPIKKGDIVYASGCFKNNKGYWYLTDYKKV